MVKINRWLQVFRIFFPSWEFFTFIETEFFLEVRVGHSHTDLSGWQNVIPPIQRSLKLTFFNPAASFLHACRNLLVQFSREIVENPIDTTEAITQNAYYEMIKNIVEYTLVKNNWSALYYQFRITARTFPEVNISDIFVSPIYAGPQHEP